jgi:hypothetical protein
MFRFLAQSSHESTVPIYQKQLLKTAISGNVQMGSRGALVAMSIASASLRRGIQLIGAGGLSLSTTLRDRCGTMRLRCLKYVDKIP